MALHPRRPGVAVLEVGFEVDGGTGSANGSQAGEAGLDDANPADFEFPTRGEAPRVPPRGAKGGRSAAARCGVGPWVYHSLQLLGVCLGSAKSPEREKNPEQGLPVPGRLPNLAA